MAVKKRLLCTFAKPETEEISELTAMPELEISFVPTIVFEPVSYDVPKNLNNYQWLVFTSKNGVRYFAEHLKNYRNKLATVGAKTAAELARYGYKSDFIGSGISSVDFAQELSAHVPEGDSLLLVLGDRASYNLQVGMNSSYKIDRLEVYKTSYTSIDNSELRKNIAKGYYDLILVASPSAVQALITNFKGQLVDWRLACIGKTTANACKKLGITPKLVSTEPSIHTLIEESVNYKK